MMKERLHLATVALDNHVMDCQVTALHLLLHPAFRLAILLKKIQDLFGIRLPGILIRVVDWREIPPLRFNYTHSQRNIERRKRGNDRGIFPNRIQACIFWLQPKFGRGVDRLPRRTPFKEAFRTAFRKVEQGFV